MTNRIDCREQCETPDGVQLVEVPRPRHAWNDVFNCPNDGCERSFMAKTTEAHNDGPSVTEAAADDRAHWTQKYAGE